MLRATVLQRLLDLFERPRYLEIGVDRGETFTALKAFEKVAVDPSFHFDVEAVKQADPAASFMQVPSDAYFQQASRDVMFDVVFIDGLHTFDQVLRDLLNCLSLSHDGTIIVVDDVIPTDYPASVKDIPTMLALRQAGGSPGLTWMGDVYKAVFFMATFLPMYQYATVLENHGQLIMWRARTRSMPQVRTISEISAKPFESVVFERDIFKLTPFETIYEALLAHRVGAAGGPGNLDVAPRAGAAPAT